MQIILQNQLVFDLRALVEQAVGQHSAIKEPAVTIDKVCGYIFDRFTAFYQEQSVSTEIIQAVRMVSKFDALDFDARIKAVSEFVKQPECEALAAANKRVGNILEKSSDTSSPAQFDPALLADDAEKALADAIQMKQQTTQPLFESGNYQQGLLALTSLKPLIDNFFDQVMVNADDEKLRNNRLALLAGLREMFIQAADIALLVPSKQ